MKKKKPPKLEVVWEQVFPEDAGLRIQRAFETLLSDEFDQLSSKSLLTTIDKDSPGTDNETSEKKIN